MHAYRHHQSGSSSWLNFPIESLKIVWHLPMKLSCTLCIHIIRCKFMKFAPWMLFMNLQGKNWLQIIYIIDLFCEGMRQDHHSSGNKMPNIGQFNQVIVQQCPRSKINCYVPWPGEHDIPNFDANLQNST